MLWRFAEPYFRNTTVDVHAGNHGGPLTLDRVGFPEIVAWGCTFLLRKVYPGFCGRGMT